MYETLMVSDNACAEEQSFVQSYNEYVRRQNADYSSGYIRKAWYIVRDKIKEAIEAGVSWIKAFRIDNVNRIICRLAQRRRVNSQIEWDCEPINRDCEQLYLLELLNDKQEIVWSKVGTTTRPTQERMIEHLRYYKKYGITTIRVNRVWECDTNAEGFESFFRACYIRKYPQGTFQQNDRFYHVQFDLDEAETLFKFYKNLPNFLREALDK